MTEALEVDNPKTERYDFWERDGRLRARAVLLSSGEVVGEKL
jgi:hypothetical protein